MPGIGLRLGWWCLIGLCVAACGGSRAVAPVSTPRGAEGLPHGGYYVVHRGDTLYSIAWRYDLNYSTLAAWNGIGNPDRIYPGQRLRLTPKPSSRTGERSPSPRLPTVSAPAAASASKPTRSSVDGREDTGIGSAPEIIWTWPARGKVIQTFSASEPAKKGLDIAGMPGQPIDAAAAGKVVYSGSGLIGYGNLIIVKHNDSYLSAYAHGARLLVKEGEWVKAGQPISEMGHTGTDRVMLHFEIRRQGKPVDPLLYLPRRPG
jgi:lipoprotein NlpD